MYKSAESVTPSHPDKICDRISDALLDACLEQDPYSRVALECMGGHNIITVTGELTTKAFINVHDIVKRIVGDKYGVQTNIVQQSPQISQGVDTGGAGDQGIMVGYATNDNEAMIPQEAYLARSLCKFIYDKHPHDGKTQITIDDDKAIISVVVSFQNVSGNELAKLVQKWLDDNYFKHHSDIKIHCNPAGDWNIGGFEADTGVTGRKLAVDNYGPQVPIGGGAFSGKDSSKVDRSAAYMARKIAVDILREYKAHEITVKLAYAIGVAQPVMATAYVNFTDKFDRPNFEEIDLLKERSYDLTPNGIIKFLDLRKPQFEQTARFGHFGNGFTWDK